MRPTQQASNDGNQCLCGVACAGDMEKGIPQIRPVLRRLPKKRSQVPLNLSAPECRHMFLKFITKPICRSVIGVGEDFVHHGVEVFPRKSMSA